MKQNDIKITYINERKEYHCTIPEFCKVDVTCSKVIIECNIHFCGNFFFLEKTRKYFTTKTDCIAPPAKVCSKDINYACGYHIGKGIH